MTIDEYADWAATVPQPSFNSEVERVGYLALGLAGEAGEVADTVRRSMREGNLEEDRLVYELGDLIFHWACMVTALGHSPSGLLAQSQDNIKARLAAREPPSAPRLP
jgi:NTP pyrophosphatase (non-canonical NTP hydrolase)